MPPRPPSCPDCGAYLLRSAGTSADPSLPLNASVSNFGTSFVFGPQPVCRGCVETELGFASLEEGRFLPRLSACPAFEQYRLLGAGERSGQPGIGRQQNDPLRQSVRLRGPPEGASARRAGSLSIAPRGVVFTRDLKEDASAEPSRRSTEREETSVS